MRISIKERKGGLRQTLSCRMLFDIVFQPDYKESKKELNEKGKRFRDKVHNSKTKTSWVGNFMPINESDLGKPHAFFVATCFSGHKGTMKEVMKKSIEGKDSITFK